MHLLLTAVDYGRSIIIEKSISNVTPLPVTGISVQLDVHIFFILDIHVYIYIYFPIFTYKRHLCIVLSIMCYFKVKAGTLILTMRF